MTDPSNPLSLLNPVSPLNPASPLWIGNQNASGNDVPIWVAVAIVGGVFAFSAITILTLSRLIR